MRSRRKLVIFSGTMLLLVGSIVGCGESYTQENLEAAFERGNAAMPPKRLPLVKLEPPIV